MVCRERFRSAVITAFLAVQGGWHLAFILPGLACCATGLVWLRVPAHDPQATRYAMSFPAIPAAIENVAEFPMPSAVPPTPAVPAMVVT